MRSMPPRVAAGRAVVDVVIPTYNAKGTLVECLRHLDDEVIASITVVDDVSDDGTPEAVGELFPGVRVVELQEHRGLSHALNAGAAPGKAPYVLFMNNDLVAEPESLARLADALAADPAAASAGARLVDERTGQTQDGYRPRDFPTLATMLARLLGVERRWRRNPWSGGHLRRKLPEDGVSRVDQQPAGACLLVGRDAFERIGGWDEGYWFWYEDVNFSRRLSAIGPALWVGPATLRHVGMHSTSAWPKHEQHRRLYLSTLRYAHQHLPGWRALVISLVMLLTCLPRWAWATMRGKQSASVYRTLLRTSARTALGGDATAEIPPDQSRRRGARRLSETEIRSG